SDQIKNLFNCCRTPDGNDFCPRNHDLSNDGVSEVKDALDHLARLGIYQPAFLPCANKRLNVSLQAGLILYRENPPDY
ncbi:MAG: hypothetical protein Q7J12_08375, partial [Syntrophales bacterium]|nr:hypothetical protein [Syntrophales bacterium]